MADMQWLEKICIFGHFFAAPNIPAACSFLGFVPQTINWQFANSFDSYT